MNLKDFFHLILKKKQLIKVLYWLSAWPYLWNLSTFQSSLELHYFQLFFSFSTWDSGFLGSFPCISSSFFLIFFLFSVPVKLLSLFLLGLLMICLRKDLFLRISLGLYRKKPEFPVYGIWKLDFPSETFESKESLSFYTLA